MRKVRQGSSLHLIADRRGELVWSDLDENNYDFQICDERLI
jgi:hypothetical protein